MKEGRALMVEHTPLHSQLGVADLLLQIANLDIREGGDNAPGFWPFLRLQRQPD